MSNGGVFDSQNVHIQIQGLERKSREPSFWDDSLKAAEVLKEINTLKQWSQSWNSVVQDADNLRVLYDLVEETNEDSYKNEVLEGYKNLQLEYGKLKMQTFFSSKRDDSNVFLSIQTGAGGTESCDWVSLLLRLYIRWCDRKNFTVKELDIQSSEGGIKSALLEVQGQYVYGHLRAETGVHRLIRISPFDSSKRRHTTFASVHALPILGSDIEVHVRAEDIRVDTYRSSGAGGQHVNKTDSAVRITHLETGIVVQCQNERSQMKNKQTAMKILQSKLYEHYEKKKKEKQEQSSEKKQDIAWGSQIRSYVFHPYNLVKDHRTNVEKTNVEKVMDGDIDDFIEAYLEKHV